MVETEVGAPRSDRAGFTLIEVLIAMLILAVGLMGLEAMAIGASRSIGAANRMTEYTLIASQQLETTLEQARSGGNPVPTVTELDNGTIVDTSIQTDPQGAAGTLWTVRVTVTPPGDPAEHLNLSPTTVTGRVLR